MAQSFETLLLLPARAAERRAFPSSRIALRSFPRARLGEPLAAASTKRRQDRTMRRWMLWGGVCPWHAGMSANGQRQVTESKPVFCACSHPAPLMHASTVHGSPSSHASGPPFSQPVASSVVVVGAPIVVVVGVSVVVVLAVVDVGVVVVGDAVVVVVVVTGVVVEVVVVDA